MVDDEVGTSEGILMCKACELAVVWTRNQIVQNNTQDSVLKYISQACFLSCDSSPGITL